MRDMMVKADLRFPAPPWLRTRVRAVLPVVAAAAPSRHTLFKGFAFGSALSAAAAALLMIAVTGSDLDQVIVSDVVSAHLRSLQANRLTDVQSSEGVEPWLGNRLGVAPPVPDLARQLDRRADRLCPREAGRGDRLPQKRPPHQSVRRAKRGSRA
jgi:anti-sigma factor RsiW